MKIKIYDTKLLGLLLSILCKYRFGKDYVIKCREYKSLIHVFNNNLYNELKTYNITSNKVFEINIQDSTNICILPRIQYIEEYYNYLNEVKSTYLLGRIIGCNKSLAIYVFLNTYTDNFILLSYLYNIFRKENIVLNFEQFVKYGFYFLKLKNIYREIKEVESLLRIKYDEKLFERYQELISNLDHIVLRIKELWDIDRGLFDKLYSIIMRINLGKNEIIDFLRSNISLYTNLAKHLVNEWKKIYIELARYYNVSPTIIDIYSDLNIETMYLNMILDEVIKYLRNRSCHTVVIVDGEDYELLKNLMKSNILVIEIINNW